MTRAQLEKHLNSDKDLAVDESGLLNYVCEGLCAHDNDQAAEALTATGNTAYTVMFSAASDAFKMHSLPGAKRVIYLDFNGHTTSGTV
jgi:hypothetical protein